MNTNKPNIFDVIVIGGGPGGLSSGLYASRQGLSTLLIEASLLTGGQMLNTETIDNYIGSKSQNAIELSEYMFNDAIKYGLEVVSGEKVMLLSKVGSLFKINTDKEVYHSYSVIVATGTKHRTITDKDINGVSYCAVCDAPFYSGLDVAVIGGGQSAVESALLLSELANSVTLIHRRNKLRNEYDKQLLYGRKNINFYWDNQVKDIKQNGKKIDLSISDNITLSFDGVFPCIGQDVDVSFIQDNLVELSPSNKIRVNGLQRTFTDGLYAVGDVVEFPFNQVAIAVSQGAIAALDIYHFLKYVRTT